MSYRVVGVRFKRAGKVYFFDPAADELLPGDEVIVETARGLEYGQIVTGPVEVGDENVVAPLKKVIRKITEEDRQQLAAIRAKERHAFTVCEQKIAAHGLPMKLVEAEKTFDESKLTFYFTAEGRIDFRELVKDLAAIFRTRIELRQIGVRDEAKMLGGLGCCGRELCCATWLADFASVSIRMAKEQNLPLNPTKISGICGRLMCCLKYENELYEEVREGFPAINSRVLTPDGEGKVTGVNIFKKTLTVELRESKMAKEYPLEQVKIQETRSDGGGSADGNAQAGPNQTAGNGKRPGQNKKAGCSAPRRKQCPALGAGACVRTGSPG